MTPLQGGRLADEKWKCAYELFERALNLPASERFTFIKSATTDPEVLSLALDLIEGTQEENEDEPAELLPKPGDRIGRYEILGKLGQGGMGSVYRARDTDLGRLAALKVLAAGVAATRVAEQRLVREAKAASALNHPHIVTIYEVVRVEGQIALVMELIEGKPLRAYCGEAQPMGRVIDWGHQIAQALAAAHAIGIVHRDVKPENVMVRPDGYLKVVDFGLAHHLAPRPEGGSTNFSGIPGGTLNYMSPEQTRGEIATSASDVFSFGMLLYEIATGAHPFATESPIDTAHAIAHGRPQPPSALNGKVPRVLSYLIESMLAKDPSVRPSAAEVERRLAGIAETGRSVPRQQVRAWVWVSILAGCVIFGFLLWAIGTKIFAPKEPIMRQVTRQADENRVTAAAVSPDGKNLAFGIVGGSVHLRRMSDGFTQRLTTPSAFHVDRIAWFRDGTRLLVSGSLDSFARKHGIWIVPVKGSYSIPAIPEGEDAVPSPDGTRIAMTSADGEAIWVVGVTGGKPHQLRAGGDNNRFSALVWSPDGKRISYQHLKYAPRDRQVDGLAPVQFERNYAYSYEAVDTATGRVVASLDDVVMTSACGLEDGRILFLRWPSLAATLTHDIWELRTDPSTGTVLGHPRRLTHTTEIALSSISASADGKFVTVVRNSPQHNVYVADLSEGIVPKLLNIRRVTVAVANDFPHAWTPDNRGVIFESDRNGKFGLFRQKIDEPDAEPLVLRRDDSVLPQLSPDGKWVLYREDGEQRVKRTLMRAPLDGGTPEPVPKTGNIEEFRCGLHPGSRCVMRSTENGQFVFYELDALRGKGQELARTVWSPSITGDWDISPDGQFVAIPNHGPQIAKIRVISLDTSETDTAERIVMLNGVRNLNGLTWAASGRGWYVTAITSAGPVLLLVDGHGESWELLKSPGTLYAVPSPDGSKIAFPRGALSSNVWSVEGF